MYLQCEYPDAPPNLTDLSQKVLTLYDTLRELEGEFLVKYMKTMDDEPEENIEPLQQDNPSPMLDQIIESEEPAGWSMSLTPTGLSIHAVTRNLGEFNEFAKTISRQIIRDFGPGYLPKSWDPDAEGYFQEDSDTEELDEDEYLVTVPVFSTCSLLFNPEQEEFSKVLFTEPDIETQLPFMLKHLEMRYQSLEEQDNAHHLVILMQQLKQFLPPSKQIESISYICILTAYVVSVKEFPPISPPCSIWRQCAEYARVLLMDLTLKGDVISPFPVILCAILLGWIDAESRANDKMIYIAIRVLCSFKEKEESWQILIGCLLYLDIYSATFRFKLPQICGEAAVEMKKPRSWNKGAELSFRETGIILEGKLMSLLNKVVRLFYQVQEEIQVKVRKIDVDEVLTLVRDIELWEEELPEWAKWNTVTEERRIGVKMHMHMIHNTVKILLFRPFSITSEQDDQTFTKTIFLDMSIRSADRLTSCLCHQKKDGFWIKSAHNLVLDVSKRVLHMFDNDQDIVDQLKKIQSRLQSELIIKGKNAN